MRFKPTRDPVQVCFGLLERDAWRQASEHAEEVRAAVCPPRIAAKAERDSDLRFAKRKHETGWQDTDDDVGRPIQRHAVADEARIGTEPANPQSVRDDGNALLAVSSSTCSGRPSSGWRPSSPKKFPDTRVPSSRSDDRTPVRFAVQFVKTASPASDDDSRR